jgi:hypothetical protein
VKNKFVPDVKFELIPINELVSDQDYQRNLSQKHVLKAAAEFDIYQINPVKVSRRDGINYVFNGQHTMEIIAAVSGSRNTPVWCMVYEDLMYQREAEIFANQMKHVKPLSSYEIFIANIESGSDKQILIKDLVESYGLSVSSTAGQGNISGVSSLEYIYNYYGYENLSRTLRLTVGAWEGSQYALASSMLKGIAKLIDVYGTEIKDEMFISKLGIVSAREITRTAHERKGGPNGFAEAILLEYNKKLKSPLSFDQLYKHRVRRRKANINSGQGEVPDSELITMEIPTNTYQDLLGE